MLILISHVQSYTAHINIPRIPCNRLLLSLRSGYNHKDHSQWKNFHAKRHELPLFHVSVSVSLKLQKIFFKTSRCQHYISIHERDCLPLSVGRVHYQFHRCWVLFFFFQILIITFGKQTMKALIRQRIMRCLIWVCTVCLYPTNRTLGIW